MAKILFINPVIRAEDTPKHVPYGMAMLAAIAMKAGHQVQVFDHNAWRLADTVLKEVLQADDWDVVASGCMTTGYKSMKSIFQASKAYAPRALTVCGGGVLTSMPHDIMRFVKEIDVGVIGEAYLTFAELMDYVHQGDTSFDNIAGLILRNGKGESYFTAHRALMPDLDVLPYPAWELFPLEEVYFPNSSLALAEESLTSKRRLDINTSYGCSLICRYCFHLGIAGDMTYTERDGKTDVRFDEPGNHTRSIRYHSPRYIIDMVKYMVDRFKVDFVTFLDENLMTMDQFSKRTWLDEICDLWIDEGLQPQCKHEGVDHDENCKTGVHWGGTSHATLCTERILKKMANAGCAYLDYGWESFSSRILKEIGKGATPANNVRSYEWTMKAGIRPVPNQMMGFPSEDFESLRDNMKAWEDLGLVVKPFFVTAYPGCEWYNAYKDDIVAQYAGDLEKYIIDLGDATDISGVISENFNSVELYGLRELMIRGDYSKLDSFEREWRKYKGDPKVGVRKAQERLLAF